jgi:hypothetical protein
LLDWTGIAFCTYQLTALGAARVDRHDVEASYVRHTRGVQSTPDFQSRTTRERLFDILCGPWTDEKAKYFPVWERTPMPLNLHGLLLLRSVSLLDQANWGRDGA